jgi:hypothetical protein
MKKNHKAFFIINLLPLSRAASLQQKAKGVEVGEGGRL